MNILLLISKIWMSLKNVKFYFFAQKPGQHEPLISQIVTIGLTNTLGAFTVENYHFMWCTHVFYITDPSL